MQYICLGNTEPEKSDENAIRYGIEYKYFSGVERESEINIVGTYDISGVENERNVVYQVKVMEIWQIPQWRRAHQGSSVKALPFHPPMML